MSLPTSSPTRACGSCGGSPPAAFKVLKASMAEFPALNGQSVSYAVLQFSAGSVNPPHTHPRASELLFLLSGSLEVGFVDTTNKLFTQTLQEATCLSSLKDLSITSTTTTPRIQLWQSQHLAVQMLDLLQFLMPFSTPALTIISWQSHLKLMWAPFSISRSVLAQRPEQGLY
ncbi:hypothetical protein RJ639_005524 [Escallonia herrerae]|uniref:Cupin type-1 domain-containing protein n=1 Tax=Escallonia herrerae TaxID=1293975 RepID=A0AA89AZN8_9ASTE|nr:hypothetical protein RJ639_005524 [Escallonia herrerae]